MRQSSIYASIVVASILSLQGCSIFKDVKEYKSIDEVMNSHLMMERYYPTSNRGIPDKGWESDLTRYRKTLEERCLAEGGHLTQIEKQENYEVRVVGGTPKYMPNPYGPGRVLIGYTPPHGDYYKLPVKIQPYAGRFKCDKSGKGDWIVNIKVSPAGEKRFATLNGNRYLPAARVTATLEKSGE